MRYFILVSLITLMAIPALAEKNPLNTISRYQHKPTPNRPIPALHAVPHNMPAQREIPDEVVQFLKTGKIAAATRRLYLEPASVKSLLLIRDMERIGEVEAGIRMPEGDLHRYYMNLGIAYHNLFLFLKGHRIAHKTYAKRAGQAYKKARRYSSALHRVEVDVLWAALDMANGQEKRAERRFNRHVDENALQSNFRGTSYLACYHAAAGAVQRTLTALHHAKDFDAQHQQLATWITISDDFFKLREDESFTQFVTSLQN